MPPACLKGAGRPGDTLYSMLDTGCWMLDTRYLILGAGRHEAVLSAGIIEEILHNRECRIRVQALFRGSSAALPTAGLIQPDFFVLFTQERKILKKTLLNGFKGWGGLEGHAFFHDLFQKRLTALDSVIP